MDKNDCAASLVRSDALLAGWAFDDLIREAGELADDLEGGREVEDHKRDARRVRVLIAIAREWRTANASLDRQEEAR
jgi:hypothetical protein